MASVGKFPYQRLKPEIGFDDVEGEKVVLRSKKRFRFRRIPIRRRLRLKVPSLRRLWRKRARLVSAMRISCAKVIKRLKDGQGHFGDLFAGNYLFMQVSPASLKYLENKHNITGMSPNFYLPKKLA